MRASLAAGLIAVGAVASAVQAFRGVHTSPLPLPASRQALAAVAATRLIRDQDMLFFQQRVARDPTGSLDLVRLGSLYLQRYRDTGDETDLISAERAGRASLDHRPTGNAEGWQLLEAALLGQHRFLEAREAAERLLDLDRDDAVSRSILGEVLLELGAYPAADTLFSGLSPRRYEGALAPRYARWLEIRGQVGEARRLLEGGQADLVRHHDVASPQLVAWYDLRLGELALRFGSLHEARAHLDAGLARVPDDWRLLAARARLALAEKDPVAAVMLGDSSLARHLDPATLAMVGDAWRLAGDSAKAREYYGAMEASTRAPSGGFHRVWYLALLDHDRRVPDILASVRRDLATRRDVYGYDLYAWALYKSGLRAEAERAIEIALAQGTEDPLLHRHADAIRAAR